MRRVFTTETTDLTRSELRWGERQHKWIRLQRGVYLEGPEPPQPIDLARAKVLAAARVDLCWPELGLFIELDGQQHKDQPVHDARRKTAVVAAMGWLVGRFTWYEVVHIPHLTTRRLAGVVEQARRRPLPQSA